MESTPTQRTTPTSIRSFWRSPRWIAVFTLLLGSAGALAEERAISIEDSRHRVEVADGRDVTGLIIPWERDIP